MKFLEFLVLALLSAVICSPALVLLFTDAQVPTDVDHVHPFIYASLTEDDPTCAVTSIDTGAVGTLIGWTTATITSSSGMVVDLTDAAGDSIIIPFDGDYGVSFASNFDGPNGARIVTNATTNGIATDAAAYSEIDGGGDIVNTGHPATVWPLLAGDRIRLEFDSLDVANRVIEICHLSLVVIKVP